MIIGGADMEFRVPDAALLALGYTPYRARSLAQARAFCATPDLDLVVLPLSLNAESLVPAVRDCTSRQNRPAIVIIAQNDEINDAAEAMRSGADDCLFSPYSETRLARTLIGALEHNGRALPTGATLTPPATPKRPATAPDTGDTTAPPAPHADAAPAPDTEAPPPEPIQRFHGLIGTSPAMQAIFQQVRTIADSDAPVLLLGETGTGKTSLAKVIHDTSDRAEGPFVVLKCAGLTAETLAETLAPNKPGQSALFDRAAGGTLLIDRMAELPGAAQARLFTALQDLEASPDADRPRLIATLSEQPTTLMAGGTLRQDLYYALKVVELTLPPLRHRTEDIPALIHALIKDMAEREARDMPTLTSAAFRALESYDWPGNLRELANVLRGLVLTGAGQRIDRNALPAAIVTERAVARLALQYGLEDSSEGDLAAAISPLIGKRLADIERAVIEATIAREDGSIPRAARVLDLSPSTIYRKRDSWGAD